MKNNRNHSNAISNVLRPLAFYHPTPENTGTALSFSYNSSENKLYLNILKQSAYDAELDRGYFDGKDKKVIKFSQLEAVSILNWTVDPNLLEIQHSFNGINSGIQFDFNTIDINQIYEPNSNLCRFNVSVELSVSEITLLRLYIETALKESFYNE